MKVRALGPQVTVYDDDMNIIKEIPPRPPVDPNAEVRMINIVDYEDMLMGIDPNQKPAHFLDVDNDERFKPLITEEELAAIKLYDIDVFLKACYHFTILMALLIMGMGLGDFFGDL